MLFAGWMVRKTVTEGSKMLHEAAGRGQHFQARGTVGKNPARGRSRACD